MYDLHVELRGITCLRRVRELIHKYLVETLPEDYFLLEVAIHEAINNGLQSSQLGDGECRVSLKIRILNDRKLIVRVKDNGPGFNGNERLLELKQDCSYLWEEDQLLADSGRGLWIMERSTDYITYNKQGNEIMFIKNLNPEKSGCLLVAH